MIQYHPLPPPKFRRGAIKTAGTIIFLVIWNDKQKLKYKHAEIFILLNYAKTTWKFYLVALVNTIWLNFIFYNSQPLCWLF